MRSPLILASFNDSRLRPLIRGIPVHCGRRSFSTARLDCYCFSVLSPSERSNHGRFFFWKWGAAILLFALWSIQWGKRPKEMPVAGSWLFLPMLAFAILVGFQLVAGITAYSYVTRSQALLYCAYAALCFLVVQYLRGDQSLKILAWAFSAYGFGVAILRPSAEPGCEPEDLLVSSTPRFGGWIYGLVRESQSLCRPDGNAGADSARALCFILYRRRSPGPLAAGAQARHHGGNDFLVWLSWRHGRARGRVSRSVRSRRGPDQRPRGRLGTGIFSRAGCGDADLAGRRGRSPPACPLCAPAHTPNCQNNFAFRSIVTA